MSKNYRRIYEKHHGAIPIDHEGRSYHIHHRDGNHNNNDPENLQAVSLEEHYKLHLEAGDWWAALRLAQRLHLSKDEISGLSRKSSLELIRNGKNYFLDKSNASRAGKKGIEHVKRNGWSEDAIQKRVETRRRNNSFKNNMKAANTQEAICKRVQTRKRNNGYVNSITASHKARIKNSILKMCNHFQQPFSYDLLEIARRKKVCRISPQNVKKHLNEEELANLWSQPPEY